MTMSPTITAPVKGYTGTVVGVDFKNGVGETEDPAALAYFGRQGYEIDGGGKQLSPKERLQAEAAELGLSTDGTKSELETRIAEHKADTIKNTDGDATTGNDDSANGGEK